MPDIPDEAVTAALTVYADLLYDRPDPMVLSDQTLTRKMLEAAAPILAERIAKAITDHADRQFPVTDACRKPGQVDRFRIWHRHFGIAARIAAGAFSTGEDKKRMAAEALARGDLIACDTPEDAANPQEEPGNA